MTLFALINDPELEVTLLLDEGFFAHAQVNFHPLRNDATTAISPAEMLAFIEALGRAPILLVFDAAGRPSLVEQKAGSAHIER